MTATTLRAESDHPIAGCLGRTQNLYRRPMTYAKGLHELGDRCHAYLQPDGGWGWSNAGLIVGDGASLLVDTLFDLKLTAEMLDAMAPLSAAAPIGTLVNTHANGDHCFGNQLVPGAEIVASAATAHEMAEVPATTLLALVEAPGDLGVLFRSYFGAFDFTGIQTTLPTRTFDTALSLDVAGRRVDLIEVGPAHTQGDTLVHVPDAGIVYTGDILFHQGTPIIWAGPLANWVAALDRIIDLAPRAVVPGHGPIADLDAVRASRDYLLMVDREARVRHSAGLDPFEAARDIAAQEGMRPYKDWGEWGRLAINVAAVYHDIDPTTKRPDFPEMFRQMAVMEHG